MVLFAFRQILLNRHSHPNEEDFYSRHGAPSTTDGGHDRTPNYFAPALESISRPRKPHLACYTLPYFHTRIRRAANASVASQPPQRSLPSALRPFAPTLVTSLVEESRSTHLSQN